MCQWYLQFPDGSEHGPYSYRQIYLRLEQGVPVGSAIKQSDGPWHSPAFARKVLKALESEGWYARKPGRDRVLGPYTMPQAQEMLESGELPLGTVFRKGNSGDWVYSATIRIPLEEDIDKTDDLLESMKAEEKPYQPPPRPRRDPDAIEMFIQDWAIPVVGSLTIIILAFSLYKLAATLTNR